jgi:hypothetical protein
MTAKKETELRFRELMVFLLVVGGFGEDDTTNREFNIGPIRSDGDLN